jgi:transcriptional antiterminator RfaH
MIGAANGNGSETTMTHWIVAQTLSQRENLAKQHLERAGFETYLPRIKARTRTKRKSRIVPLFPSYVFVYINGFWGSIMRTIGVTRVIRNGDEPAKIEQHVIDNIRSQERQGLVQLPKPQPAGRAGQKVRILRGPFAGHIGALCANMTDAERQKVLLDFLGRATVIELDRVDMSLDLAGQATQPEQRGALRNRRKRRRSRG